MYIPEQYSSTLYIHTYSISDGGMGSGKQRDAYLRLRGPTDRTTPWEAGLVDCGKILLFTISSGDPAISGISS